MPSMLAIAARRTVSLPSMRLATGTLALAALLSVGGPGGRGRRGSVDGTVGGEQLATHGLVVDAPGADPMPKVSGDAWLLADLETGEVLAAQDPHGRYRPASILKLLTAVTTAARAAARGRLHRAVGGRQRRGQSGRSGAGRDLHRAQPLRGALPRVRQRRRQRAGQRGRWREVDRRRDEQRPPAASGRWTRPRATRAGWTRPGSSPRPTTWRDRPRRLGARGRPRLRGHREVAVPGQDAAGREDPQDLRDLHAGPAAAELPRGDRGQDRLDDQGARHVRRCGDARRTHPGRDRAALRGRRLAATRPPC